MAFLEKLKRVLNKVMRHYITHNVLILFGVCIVLYIAVLVCLRYYTHHGEKLPVPSLKGLTVKQAMETLEKSGLRGRVTDSVWTSTAKRGTVTSQLPEAGSNVKEHRTIYFVINAVTPEMVTMPNVVDKTLRDAKAELDKWGLKVGKTPRIPDIAKDRVLRQTYGGKDIIKGTKLPKGSYIDLYLGSGYAD